MQRGNHDVVKKRLAGKVTGIHFERGAIKKPVVIPNHYWQTASTKDGALIQATQTLKDPLKAENRKKDILEPISPYMRDNVLRLDYLITVATKA